MNPQQPPQPTPPSDPNDATPQPVAYDSQGRPLYAAPPPLGSQPTSPPRYVHLSRATEPDKPELSPELQRKHDESVKLYPALNLSEAEYVISAVRRHPIGLMLPVGMTIFLVALIVALLIVYPEMVSSLGLMRPPAYGLVLLAGGALALLIALGGYIAAWVYRNNRFFLTNESVIQEIQLGIFSRHEQTVSLANIEDASFRQQGLLQSILNYGSIRLSTEGDETTYRFNYVANPKRQIAILNNAVEAFKNGRPLEE